MQANSQLSSREVRQLSCSFWCHASADNLIWQIRKRQPIQHHIRCRSTRLSPCVSQVSISTESSERDGRGGERCCAQSVWGPDERHAETDRPSVGHSLCARNQSCIQRDRSETSIALWLQGWLLCFAYLWCAAGVSSHSLHCRSAWHSVGRERLSFG